jgi:hypothetical protein
VFAGFVGGDAERFELLKHSAMRLGSAFQKVNFLRDLKMDYEQLNRSYFPNTDLAKLDERSKKDIIEEIEADLREGFVGICNFRWRPNWVCTSLTYTIANYYISWQKHHLRIFSTPVFGYQLPETGIVRQMLRRLQTQPDLKWHSGYKLQ